MNIWKMIISLFIVHVEFGKGITFAVGRESRQVIVEKKDTISQCSKNSSNKIKYVCISQGPEESDWQEP